MRIIRRLGIGHLFVQTLREKHRKHPSWEQQLLEALDSLVQNFPAQTILKEAGCLNQLNRSGIRQVLRLYRNAFIIPSKSQSKVRVQCLFCKQEGNEVRLSHIVECVDFEAACFHAMSFQAHKTVVKWLPTNSHMLLRLLLSFKDLSSCDKQLALDMYAVLGLAIHAGIHNGQFERHRNWVHRKSETRRKVNSLDCNVELMHKSMICNVYARKLKQREPFLGFIVGGSAGLLFGVSS